MAAAIDDKAEIRNLDVRLFEKLTYWYRKIDSIINIFEEGYYNYEHK